MKKIDYRHYNLEELESALSSIDKEQYPENFMALIEELKKRKSGEPPLKRPHEKGAHSQTVKYAFLNWAVLIFAQAWALVGLFNGSLYIPGKKGGITFSGNSVYLAFISITMLIMSGIYYMVKQNKIQKDKADKNFFWFMFSISIGMFAWACIVNNE